MSIETSLTELKINVLTKAEFETQLSLGNIGPNEFYITEDGEYAPIDSPNFIGTPTAPTATAGTNTTQIATTSFVQSAMSGAGFGDMLKSVYDQNGNGIVDNAEKVNGFTVGVNVPTNAKFTDNDTITTINGKTGAISKADIVALGIPAQDTIYTHPTSHPASMVTESTSRRFVSDAEKSNWNNKQNALGYTPLNSSLKGANGGLAELDSSGKVPSSQLPSYVDDVLEYVTLANFPSTGESGKIYIATSTNITYRWSGTSYVEISPSIALGETSSTAFRGDRGKIAYDHSQSTHARADATKVENSTTNGNIKINGVEANVYTHPSGTNPHGTTKSDVGLGDVDNTSDINKPISTAMQTALSGKSDTGHSHSKSDITDFPTSLPASGGDADTSKHLIGDDTRNVNSNPSEYMSGGSRFVARAGWQTEFKKTDTIGVTGLLSGMYCYLQTHTPWSDHTGGYPIQTAYGNGIPCWRVGTSLTTWSDWKRMSDGGNADTVGGFTVAKSVPANADFSNTTYSVISTSEIDAGVSTTSRAISGARVKHMLDKTKPVVSRVKPTNGSPIWFEEL